MELGIVGLGRMGGNIARRLVRAGHRCVVYDQNQSAIDDLIQPNVIAARDLADMVHQLSPPRHVWIMLPAGGPTQDAIDTLAGLLAASDTVIDGGNSFYRDDIRRAKTLSAQRIEYIDVGTSGGVWGLERGYCLMVGGKAHIVAAIDPILAALAPGLGIIPRTSRSTEADARPERGYVHTGSVGSGHFVKMVHNGIEYGLMQAYAEGFDILKGKGDKRQPSEEQFDLNLADIAEVWRRGSVISSWLLDLTAQGLAKEPSLATFSGSVADSGEGRWVLEAAIDEAVPANVLAAALFARFRSREQHTFGEKLLSAMRFGFGGHVEQKRDA